MSKKRENVFDYSDYKSYLNDWLTQKPRGEQARLAKVLKCHSGYLSQVLKGTAHLSLEQAMDANEYLAHRQYASEYFLLLVEWARAGSKKLKTHFEMKLKQLRDEQLILKNRFDVPSQVSEQDQMWLYSAWYRVAIHVAVFISRLQTPEALMRHFNLTQKQVLETLDRLVKIGLLQEIQGRYQAGTSHVHLANDSVMISRHHLNWRMQAMASIDRPKLDDLHYSSVISISEVDKPKVREILVRAIEEVRAVVKTTQSEAVGCYCLDWFELKRDSV